MRTRIRFPEYVPAEEILKKRYGIDAYVFEVNLNGKSNLVITGVDPSHPIPSGRAARRRIRDRVIGNHDEVFDQYLNKL